MAVVTDCALQGYMAELQKALTPIEAKSFVTVLQDYRTDVSPRVMSCCHVCLHDMHLFAGRV